MKVRIGCQVDHNANHYTFARSSGLPHGYFKQRRSPDWWVVAASLVVGVIALIVAL